MTASRRVAGLLVLQVAAFWPVWAWFVDRLSDGSDEPWGLVALLLAVGLYSRLPATAGPAVAPVAGTVATFVYVVAFPFAPPLVRAATAVLAIALTAAPCRQGGGSLGLIGLLFLSLPVIPSLQFYLGHPLRVLSGRIASGLLQASGLSVAAEGTCLRFGSQLVSIDAPCSGVRMLWGGLLLACVLAVLLRLGATRTLGLLAGAASVVVVANGVRAAALFLPETGVLVLPAWTHSAIGLVSFAGAGFVVLRAAVSLLPAEDLR